jgi:dipeptidyl aminopeptidase/acylaminoacyl peptidase
LYVLGPGKSHPQSLGSAGYGKAFVNAGDKHWGGKMHGDLVDAVDWAIGRGYADPEKIAVVGASYGIRCFGWGHIYA